MLPGIKENVSASFVMVERKKCEKRNSRGFKSRGIG